MRELSYRAHDGRTIDLDCDDMWVADLQDMRANAWTYTLATRGIKGVSRSATTSKMTIRTKQPTLLDDACALFDMDMQAQSPGTITVNGEWSQRAYIVASSLGMLPMPDYAQLDCTVVLCDGVWRKALPTQHFFPMAAGTGGQLDLPTDLPTDLGTSKIAMLVSNPGVQPAEFAATIFGPCSNPAFTIGSNRYEITDVTIPSGGYVALSATGLDKSIKLVATNGDITDIFDHGQRGNGAGDGKYIFEPIPAGSSLLEISANFGIDLTIYQQSGGVPWSTLS
nr:MAG TPA: hypothetical protein [Bacteriophage sp.]